LCFSLFQHYRLYEFLFYSTREEIVIGTEVSEGAGGWGWGGGDDTLLDYLAHLYLELLRAIPGHAY
jgi:hypothetical protein